MDYSGGLVPFKEANIILWVRNDDSLNWRGHGNSGTLDQQTAMAGEKHNPAEIRNNKSLNGMSFSLRLSVGSQYKKNKQMKNKTWKKWWWVNNPTKKVFSVSGYFNWSPWIL